ncbi:MAG TPA: hypothetical protein VMA31_18500, partial [Bryobacteraceae bacterium]|nr:hypothetical protein [Bryobacteraceae bacterium]
MNDRRCNARSGRASRRFHLHLVAFRTGCGLPRTRVRRAHDAIGDAVGFQFVLVVHGTHRQLGLNCLLAFRLPLAPRAAAAAGACLALQYERGGLWDSGGACGLPGLCLGGFLGRGLGKRQHVVYFWAGFWAGG